MSYPQILEKLLDLPKNMVLQEASSKLKDTFLFVNGELRYARVFGEAGILVQDSRTEYTLTSKSIESIEVWLPKTGVYFNKEKTQPVFLQRRPVRQWRKSFSTSFYRVDYFGLPEFPIVHIDPESHTNFWVRKDNVVFFNDVKVGLVKNKETLICSNRLYEQEVRDWVKETKIPFYPKNKSGKEDVESTPF